MARTNYTMVHDTGAKTISAEIDGNAVFVDNATFAAVTGWELKPEGFCRDAVCVPAVEAVREDGAVDLASFAHLTSRPLIVDQEATVISIGEAATTRGAELSSLEAPDFSLPDLTGTMHRLSDYRSTMLHPASTRPSSAQATCSITGSKSTGV